MNANPNSTPLPDLKSHVGCCFKRNGDTSRNTLRILRVAGGKFMVESLNPGRRYFTGAAGFLKNHSPYTVPKPVAPTPAK